MQLFERRFVVTAAHGHDAAQVLSGPGHAARHEPFASRLFGRRLRARAHALEIRGEALLQGRFRERLLEQVIPERVEAVHAELGAQARDRAVVAPLGIGVAVAHAVELLRPGGQVHEAHVGAHLLARGECGPLR
jgi:hypothetical protein